MPEKQFQIHPIDLPRQPEKTYLIVDVRSSKEYNYNRIRGAINLPFDENQDDSQNDNQENLEANLPIDKQTDILLYSQNANRSIYALIFYYLSGYENVRYIDGGLNSWKAANRKVSTLHGDTRANMSDGSDATKVMSYEIETVIETSSKPSAPSIHITGN